MQGKAGKPTKILVNHYEIQSLPTKKTYAYEMSFKVPESSQRRGNATVSPTQLKFVMRHPEVGAFLKENFVFDGVSMGWSATLLMPTGERRTTLVDFPSSKPDRPNQVEIEIFNKGSLNILALVKYLTEQKVELDPMGNKEIEPLLKWINAVYRQDPASRWVTRPNSNAYYDRAPGTYMPLRSTAEVLEAVRGVFQTVQIRFGKLTINVDTSTTAFWSPDKNFLELAHALTGVPRHEDLQAAFLRGPERFIAQCDRLVGIFFCVRHLSEARNARRIKFQKWARGDAFTCEFDTDREGLSGKTTVNELTRDQGERYKEPLQGAETADFIKFATAPAFVRREQITENVKKLQWHTLSAPKSMGLSIKPHMLELPGRILQRPTLQYGSGPEDGSGSSDMGGWNLRGKRLIQPKSIKSWGLMYLPAGPVANENVMQEFARNVQRGFGSLGIGVPQDLPVFLKGNANGDFSTMVAELLSKASQRFSAKPDLLMFMLHGSSERIYAAIKNVCDVQFGVPSQVMLVEKALSNRGQLQYLANVALKVNVKLGGINATITEPLFRKSRWMLLGGDTSHPSPAQLRLEVPPPTFCALSATYDPSCCAYTSVASAQFSKDQIINDFGVMFEELLKRYSEKNGGKLPESILYYRDGLSESQISAIMAQEVDALKEVCEGLKGPKPKLMALYKELTRHTLDQREMTSPKMDLIWADAVSQYNKTTGINLHDAGSPRPRSADELRNLLD
ncbi:MAG: hypothetical protein M1826_007145 [Phylliscum demangeonii]|nr:MAG: hypothetical protein M1826_007145 [Phylliscum demangeonii]